MKSSCPSSTPNLIAPQRTKFLIFFLVSWWLTNLI
jgi:hypothetical protein